MNRRRLLLSSGALAVMPSLSHADVNADATRPLVALSGQHFRQNDQDYLLTDVAAPTAMALGDGHILVDEARKALQNFLRSGVHDLRPVGVPDRWGRQPVMPMGKSSSGNIKSIQRSMVEVGAVWVQPQTDELSFIDDLISHEVQARTGEVGLWRFEDFRVRSALAASGAVGNYRLVQGQIVSVAIRRDYTYLNFGADYKADFTATIRSSLARKWLEHGIDFASFEGEEVLIRGFVEWINGPSIALKHRQQIQLLPQTT